MRQRRVFSESAFQLMTGLVFCSADKSLGVDLYMDWGRSQGANLDQRGAWEVSREKLLTSPPDLFALGNVGQENSHLNYVIHATAFSLYQILDLLEGPSGLIVHAAIALDVTVAVVGRHTRNEQLIPIELGICPSARSRLPNLR